VALSHGASILNTQSAGSGLPPGVGVGPSARHKVPKRLQLQGSTEDQRPRKLGSPGLAASEPRCRHSFAVSRASFQRGSEWPRRGVGTPELPGIAPQPSPVVIAGPIARSPAGSGDRVAARPPPPPPPPPPAPPAAVGRSPAAGRRAWASAAPRGGWCSPRRRPRYPRRTPAGARWWPGRRGPPPAEVAGGRRS
jgi:hypothetical protein